MDRVESQFKFEADGHPLEPLDDGEPGFRIGGLREIEGTFSGTLDAGVEALLGGEKHVQMLYLYGPDPNTPWWKRMFYRLRERFTGEPYPSIVLASGPATMNFSEAQEDGDVVFEGTFTKAGLWTFHDEAPRS